MIYSSQEGFLQGQEPKLPLSHSAVQYGFGLFETLRFDPDRGVIWLKEHLARLSRGADALQLPLAMPLEEMAVRLSELAAFHPQQLQRLKILALEGVIFLQSAPYQEAKQTLTVMASTGPRSLPQLKTTSYLPALVAWQQAQTLGFDDCLLLDDVGLVCEATRSNLFWVTGGKLFTTRHQALPGVAQGFFAEKLKAQEAKVSLEELLQAEEVILTNSLMGARPVQRIEEQEFPTPGPVWKGFMDFWEQRR